MTLNPVFIISLFGGLFHLAYILFGFMPPLQFRPIHLAIIIVLILLNEIQKKKRPAVVWVNTILIILTLCSIGYVVINYEMIALKAGYVLLPTIILGVVLTLVILIVTQKVFGKVLTIVTLIFLAYAFLGGYIPQPIGHAGIGFGRVVNFLYTTGNGIFGLPLDVSARYICIFLIMAEYFSRCGAEKLFIAIAYFVAKFARAGAAKASVVASALFGTLSGTPIANILVTGSFTIPMMKRSGFSPIMAAAVEASASTGGIIMPPIMGAGAFIMAELLGVPYAKVMIAAAIPAILYFFSLYVAIDLYALKNMPTVASKTQEETTVIGEEEEELPRIRDYIHTIIPLVVFLICILYFKITVFRGALIAIVSTPIASWLRPHTRMGFKDIILGISDGMFQTTGIGAATAAAGIIVGIISLSGLGFTFSNLLGLFSEFPFGALIATALICIVVGMGMPAVASYLIVATLSAPVLIKFGFIPIAAHLFILYFASFSSITPPVALGTFTACSLAKSDPWKTGLAGFKLAAVGFLAPFIFVYSDALLLQGISFYQLLAVIPTAIIGTLFFVCGLQGYLYLVGEINMFLRALLVVAGVILIFPGLLIDLIVLASVILIIYKMLVNKKISNAHQPAK